MEDWHISFTKLGTSHPYTSTTVSSWVVNGTIDSAQCSAMQAIMASIQETFGEHPVSWPEGCTVSYQRLAMMDLLRYIADGDFVKAIWIAARDFGWTFTITKDGSPPVGYPVRQIVQDKARGLLRRH